MLNFFENDPVLSCFAYICSTERRVHFSQHELENCGNRDDQTVGVTKHVCKCALCDNNDDVVFIVRFSNRLVGKFSFVFSDEIPFVLTSSRLSASFQQ